MVDTEVVVVAVPSADSVAPRSDDVDLREMWRGLRRDWWRPLAGLALGLAVAVVLLQILPRTYTVTLKVTASSAPSNRLGGALGGFGSIAAIAGVSVANQSAASAFDLYVDRLTSRSLAAALATNRRLMIGAFPTEWDADARRWREPQSPPRLVLRAVEPLLGVPVEPWHPPGAAELQDYLARKLEISRPSLKDPPITSVAIEAKHPAFGIELLTALNAEADAEVRHDSLDRASRYAAYLDARLKTIQIAEHRQAITEVLSDQEKQIMTASSSTPYAATVVDPPVSSRLPTRPNAIFVLVLGMVLGLLLGVGNSIWRTLGRR